MTWLFLVIPFVQAKEIRVPSLPLSVHLQDEEEMGEAQPWGLSEGDALSDIKLSMRNPEEFITVTFRNTDYQPNLEAVKDTLIEELDFGADDDMPTTPGEIQIEEHEKLGEYISIPLEMRDNFMEQDLWGEVILLPVEASGVLITAVTSKEEPEHLEEQMALLLDMLEIRKEAVAVEDLPYGKLTTDAGYTLELPDEMRALTEEEAKAISTSRIAGEGAFSGSYAEIFVVDTRRLGEEVFRCTASADGTLEVIDPARSPRAASNFEAFAQVQLKGGRFRFVSGSDERFIDVMTEMPVQPEGEPNLEFFSLGDREAYLYTVEGSLYDDPVKASLFYTAWDDVALLCATVADEDEPSRIGDFHHAMRGLRVIDGELYPMHFSLKAKYLRWWPTTHPALQLYWLPFPIFLLAGWLVFRD